MDEPTQTAARRSRPLITAVGAVVAAGGAFLLPFLVYAARTTDPSLTPGVDAVSDIIVVGVGVAPLALGLWLVYIGAPSLPATLRARAATLATREFWRTGGTWLLRSSVGRAALAMLVTVGGAIVLPRGARWIGAFVAITVYSVADPIANAFRPAWWLHALQSVAGWAVLFIACGAISEIDDLREGAMVFLAPAMLYPPALGLSGLVRLVYTLRRRAGRPPSAERTEST